MRELRRHGQRTLVGVYFRIPDHEEVLVGHYGDTHHSLTAAEASAFMTRRPTRAASMIQVT